MNMRIDPKHHRDPVGFRIRRHKSGHPGTHLSHGRDVSPYGGSATMQSTLPAASVLSTSRQSPCNIEIIRPSSLVRDA